MFFNKKPKVGDVPKTRHIDGDKFTFLGSDLHSIDDKPAVVLKNGTQKWYFSGRIHREDGPAVIYPDGTKRFYRGGRLLETVFADGHRVVRNWEGQVPVGYNFDCNDIIVSIVEWNSNTIKHNFVFPDENQNPFILTASGKMLGIVAGQYEWNNRFGDHFGDHFEPSVRVLRSARNTPSTVAEFREWAIEYSKTN